MVVKQIRLALVLLMAVLHRADAQQWINNNHQDPNDVALQFTAGTQGVGGDLSYALSHRSTLRGGLSFIPVTANNVVHISGFNATSTASLNFSNIHLMGDFTPLSGMPGLRLVFGSAYFIQANGNFELQPTDVYKFGDIVLTQADVGKVNMNANWKGIAPYLGLGLARIMPKRFFNVNLDVGTYYLNQPQAQIIGTGLLDGSASQTAQLNRNIRNYRFLPVVQLNFGFKLSKR
jgi:hypothetical protein